MIMIDDDDGHNEGGDHEYFIPFQYFNAIA